MVVAHGLASARPFLYDASGDISTIRFVSLVDVDVPWAHWWCTLYCTYAMSDSNLSCGSCFARLPCLYGGGACLRARRCPPTTCSLSDCSSMFFMCRGRPCPCPLGVLPAAAGLRQTHWCLAFLLAARFFPEMGVGRDLVYKCFPPYLTCDHIVAKSRVPGTRSGARRPGGHGPCDSMH